MRQLWTDVGPTRRRSLIIYSTFSRSKANPNRFRVIFPFKQPTSLTGLKAVYHAIEIRLKEGGYNANDAKLDLAYKSGVQPSYLPCINRAHKDWALFESYGLERDRDFKKYGIDPTTYEITAPMRSEGFWVKVRDIDSEFTTDQIETILEGHASRAQEMKGELLGMKQDRHALVFRFGVRLSMAWKTEGEIRDELNDVARGESHMLAKVPHT